MFAYIIPQPGQLLFPRQQILPQRATQLPRRYSWSLFVCIVSVSGSISCSFISVSSDFGSLLSMKFAEREYGQSAAQGLAPAAINAMLAAHTGHIALISLPYVRLFCRLFQILSQSIEPILPRIYDTPPPTGPPASAVLASSCISCTRP